MPLPVVVSTTTEGTCPSHFARCRNNTEWLISPAAIANQVTNFRISSCPSLSHSPEVQPNFRDQASCCDRSKPSWKDAISNSEQPTQSTWYRSGPPALQQSYSCLTHSSSLSKPSPLSC